MLIARLTDAIVAPEKTLKEDFIGAAPELGFFRSGNEAMVYRVAGNPMQVQAMIFGGVTDAIAAGQLIAEAQRRNAL